MKNDSDKIKININIKTKIKIEKKNNAPCSRELLFIPEFAQVSSGFSSFLLTSTTDPDYEIFLICTTLLKKIFAALIFAFLTVYKISHWS